MLDEDSGSLYLARDPLGIKPLYFLRRAGRRDLRVRAEGAGRRGRTRAAHRARRADRVDALLLAARAALRDRRRGQAAAGFVGRVPAGRQQPARDVLARDRRRDRGGGRAARRPAHGDRGVGRRAHGRRRTGVHVPQRRSRLQPGHRAGEAASIRASTRTRSPSGAQDQQLEAMPDDAIYARKVAQQFGIDLHEIEIAPDVVELLPRIVDILDEPIGDPAAINTLLMCDTARDAGVKVLLSGMGADELFGGYRKHLACVMGAQYQRLPGVLRNGLIGPTVRRLPVTVERSRPAVRALGEAVPDLRGPARGDRVPAQLHDVRRGPAGRPDQSGPGAVRREAARRAQRHLPRHHARRSREPDVPGRLADVPAGAQPGLHRPVQHGRVDRGPDAVRGPDRRAGGVLDPGQREDPPAGRASSR